MTVAGLDQSYTGFGYCANGVAKKKGFPPGKYGSPGLRLLAIGGWLEEWLISLGPVDLVAMEGYANAAKFGREAAGELGWEVKRTVYNVTGLWPLIIPPTSLKKFVTGKGNAKKSEMLLGVFKRWGESFADDNQADSFALEKFGQAYLAYKRAHAGGYETGFPQFQIEVIEKVLGK
jgi:hypothetical protein